MRSVRSGRWKYIRNLRPDAEHHTHIDQGKAVDGNAYWASWIESAKSSDRARRIVDRYFRRPAEELYDLNEDAHENTNLAAANAATIKPLRAALDAEMKRQGDEGLATEQAVLEAFRPEE
jgi:hypothetical protein